jgi:hypothetical protein
MPCFGREAIGQFGGWLQRLPDILAAIRRAADNVSASAATQQDESKRGAIAAELAGATSAERGSSTRSLVHIGRRLAAQNHLERALATFERAILVAPDEGRIALANRGRALGVRDLASLA